MSWNGTETGGDGGDRDWNAGGAESFNDNIGFDDASAGFGDDGDGGNRAHGACFNCGEEGHMKSDCPNPRVQGEFTGECRSCGKEGHRASDCPDRPPMQCRNCGEEGHRASECEAARVIDRSNVADVEPEEAWTKIRIAAHDRDMDDVKEALQEYLKTQAALTYPELETAFRQQNMGVYIIAIKKPQLIGALTNMDLQGNLGKKYTISYRFDPKPARERERQYFPENTEDNLERLKDAGEPVDSGKIKCNNCEEYGHSSRDCPSDKVERDQVMVKCFNCGEEGHRVRDCPTPRIDKFACKNCNQPGHKVADCPEPPNLDNVECRKCNEMGHFSRDCPQGGGGGGACHNCGEEGHRSKECTKVLCRNCDAEGHVSRDCPKPRDYSRVKCSNCGKMGHTKVRCKEPVADPDADETGGDGAFNNTDTAYRGDDAGATGGYDVMAGDAGGAEPAW